MRRLLRRGATTVFGNKGEGKKDLGRGESVMEAGEMRRIDARMQRAVVALERAGGGAIGGQISVEELAIEGECIEGLERGKGEFHVFGEDTAKQLFALGTKNNMNKKTVREGRTVIREIKLFKINGKSNRQKDIGLILLIILLIIIEVLIVLVMFLLLLKGVNEVFV